MIALFIAACIHAMPGQCEDYGMSFVGSTLLDSTTVTDRRHAVVSGAEYGVVIGLSPNECAVC